MCLATFLHFPYRRQKLMEALEGSPTFPLSITIFPQIGCPGFTKPEYVQADLATFFPEESIWTHPRYLLVLCTSHSYIIILYVLSRIVSKNIAERRGEKPPINIPSKFAVHCCCCLVACQELTQYDVYIENLLLGDWLFLLR